MDASFIETNLDEIRFEKPDDFLNFMSNMVFTKEARLSAGLSDDKGERVSLKIYLTVLTVNNLLE